MTRRPRILFAGLFHETHTFVEGRTGMRDFSIHRGQEMLAASGDHSPLGGALAAAARLDWEILPAADMRAMPSALADDEVVETFWRELSGGTAAARARGLDGIFLVLHGAMVSPSWLDVEGELLARLRSIPGVAPLPVFGVFDLHANFTAAMAAHANGLVAYRENPHTDARASAVRAVELLARALARGSRPRTFWRHPPIMWPPTGTGTADEPLRSLETLARDLEGRHENFWCVNVAAGFAFADIPETGVSFTIVTTGPAEEAEAALDELAALAWQLRERGNAIEEPVETVVERALREPVAGLTVIAEPSDNVGAGASGDGTGLLRAWVCRGVQNAALALADPAAVARLSSLTPGGRATLPLGGKGSRFDAGPLELEVELVSRSNGHFDLADPHSHLASAVGNHFEMGPCAVVRHLGITLLLTSRPTPPMDLGQWMSQGVDPAKFSFLGVKAAVAHRGAYEPIAARMLWAGTPGPCTSRLASLPYRRIQRPIYPLDEIANFANDGMRL